MDDDDERVFNAIIVISDRRVLNKQLQATVRAYEKTRGLVAVIDGTSAQLKEALESGKQIIVTTLQKFPVIVDSVGKLSGKRFALLIDEAHSSQGGSMAQATVKVLTQDGEEEEDRDYEDMIHDEIAARGKQENISVFAFTATPKSKTLELFGRKLPDSRFAAHSLYSMRQAIEEGFILDVLQNYTTYSTYWKLNKDEDDDPEVESRKAKAILRRYVLEHPETVRNKVDVIMSHFCENSVGRINGRAKAMIVTSSRMNAVKYRLAVDAWLKENPKPFKALVAFTDTISINGKDYTEANMNGFGDGKTASKFDEDEYRILIVANKYQTGFDQPLLHTMYVDKRLGGVNAVQTLSRLNRVAPGKRRPLFSISPTMLKPFNRPSKITTSEPCSKVHRTPPPSTSSSETSSMRTCTPKRTPRPFAEFSLTTPKVTPSWWPSFPKKSSILLRPSTRRKKKPSSGRCSAPSTVGTASSLGS